jgi:hypothetical protein
MWGTQSGVVSGVARRVCRKAGQPIAKLDRKISVTSPVLEVRFGRKGFVASLIVHQCLRP